MALGDLVTESYGFEFNGLGIGAGSSYDLLEVNDLLGFEARSDSVTRFGRHGGSGGRHYAEMKNIVIKGNVLATTDTDYANKRTSLASAFRIIKNPADAKPLIFALPNASLTKVQVLARPTRCDVPLDRQAALKYPKFDIRMEILDPVIYSFVEHTSSFIFPTDTNTINNAGNEDTPWELAIVGPATNPIVTNMATGQFISFTNLILNGAQTLVLDSSNSTAKVNGTSVANYFNTGFSWWNLPPGNTDIKVEATTALSGSAMLTWRDGYWIP